MRAFLAARLRLFAPEHLKVEVIRALQLGVRDHRYSPSGGLEVTGYFLALPILYVANDRLFVEAFRIATRVQMALYDALYLALADTLDAPLVTADRRAHNLARQRGIARVVWFEDFSPG